MSPKNSKRDAIAMMPFNPALSSLPCDHYHHHYHYQSSAQYIWLAETLLALGQKDDALNAYGKAVFQDHLNAEAITRKKAVECEGTTLSLVPLYDTHPATDAEFCEAVGKAPTAATALHDEAAACFAARNHDGALTAIDRAIAAEPRHINSYLLRGKIHFMQNEYEKAKADLQESVRLAHLDHEAYHRTASAEHLTRARKFCDEQQYDLAITDCTKALDLDHTNKDALLLRAEIYRTKGNEQMAQWDEIDLKKLES
jgi:tetratricopeptide (TPR) repeat protein